MTTRQIQTTRSTGTGRQVFETVDVEVQNGVVVSPGGGGAVAVVNKGASALAKDDLVYVSGVTDGVLEVQLADANVDDLVAQFFLPAALAVGQTGLAYASGLSVATLNTNAGNVDDPVYLSETAGGWTLTPPTAAGSRVEVVGRIAVKSATVGQIMWSVGPTIGSVGTSELQDLAVTLAKVANQADGTILIGDGTNRPVARTLSGDVTVDNTGAVTIGTGVVERSMLTEDALVAAVPINILSNAGAALLAAETAGTFNVAVGTNTLLVQGEITDNETEVSVGYALVTLPENYVAAGDVTVRIPAAIILTAAAVDNGSTLDVEVYEQASGAVGADLCATAAASFAALDTWYNKDFVVTAAGLVAGDKLLIKITSSIIDSEAGGGTLRLNIEAPQLLLDVKG